MCLGIPGKVLDIFEEHGLLMGKIDFGGIGKKVCLEHVRDARVGDYVVVHVGFALSKIDEEEAVKVFDFLKTLELENLEGPEGLSEPIVEGQENYEIFR